MNKTEKIKIMSLQGMKNCDIAKELNVSRQRVSAAIHYVKSYGKRGRKSLPLVCSKCQTSLNEDNKSKYHRHCKTCANLYAMKRKYADNPELILSKIAKLQEILK